MQCSAPRCFPSRYVSRWRKASREGWGWGNLNIIFTDIGRVLRFELQTRNVNLRRGYVCDSCCLGIGRKKILLSNIVRAEQNRTEQKILRFQKGHLNFKRVFTELVTIEKQNFLPFIP